MEMGGAAATVTPGKVGVSLLAMHVLPRSDSAERSEAPARDSELLERVATGDRQALAALVARYSASLYALAFAILSDPAEAQEIVDTAFREVLWEARHFHPSHYPVGRWLADATREAAAERRRTRP